EQSAKCIERDRLDRSRPVPGRARPRLLRTALVQPRLPRRHLPRLLVHAPADPRARRAHGPPPCRRPGLLRVARRDPGRTPWLRPLLPPRLLSGESAGDPEAVGRRHELPRRGDRHQPRDPLPGAQGAAELAAHPRLCRLRRSDRPVHRAARKLRQRRAVGGADGRALGGALSGGRCGRRRARPPAAPEPAVRSDPGGPRPVRHPELDVLAHPRPLRTGHAGRRLSVLLRPVPFRRGVRPRARRPPGRVRGGDRPAHGPMAVRSDDPRRRLPDGNGQRPAAAGGAVRGDGERGL
ncbi:MAG: Prolipoprotein diacylglyceryl transferase, partial [uncultured Sphingomonas sp.]